LEPQREFSIDESKFVHWKTVILSEFSTLTLSSQKGPKANRQQRDEERQREIETSVKER